MGGEGGKGRGTCQRKSEPVFRALLPWPAKSHPARCAVDEPGGHYAT